MTRSSNIRVAVQFKRSTVFAGEDVECIITFKNTSHDPYGSGSAIESRSRKPTTQRRLSASLHNSVKRGARPVGLPSQPLDSASEDAIHRPINRHGRSLSIISIGSENDANSEQDSRKELGVSRPPNRGHARAKSLQIQPRRPPLGAVSSSDGSGHLNPSPLSSPGVNTPPITLQNAPLPHRSKRSNSVRYDITPKHIPRKSPSIMKQEFKFPPATSNGELSASDEAFEIDNKTRATAHTLSPITKIIPGTSIDGTPRSSIDLYSMSNHSDETLASEYPTQQTVRQSVRNPQFRLVSNLPDVEEQAGPETLMMGYAQVQGSFVLDGSLVNQGPFEEVKRRGVLGGQGGGGVVGVERKKRDSGLFGAFGWNNIGESIGGLLGGGELSSIKEMRSIANTRAIPLLTTPQSVLFVNLELKAEESKKYSFRFKLPKGLPPTHKGRTIKVSYNITIGVQRPSSHIEQKIRSIDIPFRVFGTVNARGDVLIHDLLTPHILLRDLARSASITEEIKPIQASESDLPSFMNYVQALLQQQSSGSGLLSPTTSISPNLRRASSLAEPSNSKEAIDLAILRSNQTSIRQNLSTRFSISRSSRPVATISLSRTAYRLGETISLTVDFSAPIPQISSTDTPPIPETSPSSDLSSSEWPAANPSTTITSNMLPHIPVYAVLVTLETHETVSPAISMRSPASIARYTRKIHAQFSESAHFARRLAFGLAIPPTATPEFKTSGVGLDWRIRVEFVTPRLKAAAEPVPKKQRDEDEEDEDEEQDSEKDDEPKSKEWTDLLEEISTDDRGSVLHGVELLNVETFEVSVPIRVYGAIMGSKSDGDVDDLAI